MSKFSDCVLSAQRAVEARDAVAEKVSAYRGNDGKPDVFEGAMRLLEHFGFTGYPSLAGRGRAIVSLAHGEMAEVLRAFERNFYTGFRPAKPAGGGPGGGEGGARWAERLEESLRAAYDRIVTSGWLDRDPQGAPQGRGALAKQRADERFFSFKSGDDWLSYDRALRPRDPVQGVF